MKQFKHLTSILFTSVLTVILITACKPNADPVVPKDKGAGTINIEDFKDTSADPATDFYKYAIGKWQKENPYTAEKGDVMLSEPTTSDAWYENFLKNGGEPVYDKMKALYEAAENNNKEFENIAFYKALLAEIDKIATPEEGIKEFEKIISERIANRYVPVICYKNKHFYYSFEDGMFADPATYAASMPIFLGEQSMSELIPMSEFDFNYGDTYKALLNAAGYEDSYLENIQTGTKDYIETQLEISLGETLPFPDEDDMFDRSFVLAKNFEPNTNIITFIKNTTGCSEENAGLSEGVYIVYDVINKIYSTPNDKLDSLKNYLRYLVISGSINDSKIRKLEPVFENMYNTSRYYIKERGNEQVYAKINTLCDEFKQEFIKRLQNSNWLSAEGKEICIEKIKAMQMYTGIPSAWDDSYLIKVDEEKWVNYDAAKRDISIQEKAVFKKIIENPNDENARYAFFYSPCGGFTAYANNGKYYPELNAFLLFPGLIWSHCYDMNRDEAYNYGGLGYVICHEMTHALDENGARYDKDGIATYSEYGEAISNILPAKDTAAFTEKTNALKAYYNTKYFIPGQKTDGEKTLSENIADLGGVAIAYDAMCSFYKDDPYGLGLAEESRRFFLAYATNFVSNFSNEYLKTREENDSHAQSTVRYNAVLSQFKPWADYYHPTPETTDALGNNWYVDPKDMIVIW